MKHLAGYYGLPVKREAQGVLWEVFYEPDHNPRPVVRDRGKAKGAVGACDRCVCFALWHGASIFLARVNLPDFNASHRASHGGERPGYLWHFVNRLSERKRKTPGEHEGEPKNCGGVAAAHMGGGVTKAVQRPWAAQPHDTMTDTPNDTEAEDAGAQGPPATSSYPSLSRVCESVGTDLVRMGRLGKLRDTEPVAASLLEWRGQRLLDALAEARRSEG